MNKSVAYILGIIMGRVGEIVRKMKAQEPYFYGDLDEQKFCDFIEKVILKRQNEILKLIKLSNKELENRLKEIIFKMEKNKLVNFRR